MWVAKIHGAKEAANIFGLCNRKDRNGMDLTEAEDIKKSWQEYTK